MDDTEVKKRLQVLRMAQLILEEESTARFNIEYKQWVADSDVLSHTTGATLEVPIPPPPPTEAEIVARALEYYNAATASMQAALNTKIEETTVAETKDPVVAADAALDPVRKIFATPVADSFESYDRIDTIASPLPDVASAQIKDILSSWFHKNQPVTRELNV